MSFYEWFNKKYDFDLNDFRSAAEIAGHYEEWIDELLMILYNHLYCNGDKEKARPFEACVRDIVDSAKAWLAGEVDYIA